MFGRKWRDRYCDRFYGEEVCDNLVPIEDFSGYFTRCTSLLFKVISFHSVAMYIQYISLKSIFF